MSDTLLLAADSSRARFFKLTSRTGPLTEIRTLACPQARLHSQILTTDLPGRTFDSHGEGRHKLEERTGIQAQVVTNFALQIAGVLDKLQQSGQFKQIIIICAPQLLGLLRNKISGNVSGRISCELARNITQLSPEEILHYVPEQVSFL